MKRLLFSSLLVLTTLLSFSQTAVKFTIKPDYAGSFTVSDTILQTRWSVYSGPTSELDADKFEVYACRNAVSLQTGNGLIRMQPDYAYETVVTYKGGNVSNKAIPTSKQIPGAKSYLIRLLQAAPQKPVRLIVENEENWNMQNGSVDAYVAWFLAVADVGKQFGIPVTNGGTTMPEIKALCSRYLDATGRTDEAKAFRNRNQIGKAMISKADWILQEMAALKNAGYGNMPWNFHYQFDTPESVSDMQLCVEAIRYYGYDSAMNNEVGWRSNDETLTAAGIQACKVLVSATVYNTTGEQGSAKPFTDSQIKVFKKTR